MNKLDTDLDGGAVAPDTDLTPANHEAPATREAPATDTPPEQDDEWSRLAREWNEGTTPKDATPSPEQIQDEIDQRSFDEICSQLEEQYNDRIEQAALTRDYIGIRQQAEAIRAHLEQIQAETARRVDAVDFRDLLAEARSALPEVSEETLTSLLAGAYYSDEKVRAAWDNRHAHETHYRNRFESLIGRIRAELTPKYDAAATADREAVASFMRGTTIRPEAPAFAAKQLSSMTDTDFKKLLDKLEPGLSERTRI